MGYSICWVTSGHLCSNPRLLKEAKACSNLGYAIHIIACQYLDSIVAFDEEIVLQNPTWNIQFIRASKSTLKTHIRLLYTAIVSKLANVAWGKTKLYPEYALGRFYKQQLQLAEKQKVNLFIAHNMAALPVAVNAAKKQKVLCGFDAEDFHRGEGENQNDRQHHLIEQVERKYFSHVNYFTAASPLIATAYQKIYPNYTFHTILNVFSKSQLHIDKNMGITNKERLKLFWFSQTVGLNRGLQDVLKAVNVIEAKTIVITILGIASLEVKTYLQSLLTNTRHSIVWLNTMKEDDLIGESCLHDIGLALEPAFSINNNIALSNKIFTYLLAGNAIIASDTAAQKLFMDENPGCGFLYEKGNDTQLATILANYIQDDALLQEHKKNARQLAVDSYNWEVEQHKFTEIINRFLA